MLTITEVKTKIIEFNENALEYHKQAVGAVKDNMTKLQKQALSRKKKCLDQVKFYIQIELFLQSCPDPALLKYAKNVLQVKIRAIYDRRPKGLSAGNPDLKKLIQAHDTMYGLKKLNEQFRVLSYILKGE